LPNPSSASAIPNPKPPKREETFDEYENTFNYHIMRRPQKPRKSSSHEEPLDPYKDAFLKRLQKS
jgi:hypothetical protein